MHTRIFIAITFLFFSNQIVSQCNRVQDSLALVEIYSTTNGPEWINTWNLNNPINNWYGIFLNNMGCVDSINLDNNNLEGELPLALKDLSGLRSVVMGNNNLFGCFDGNLIDLCNYEFTSFINNPLMPWMGDLSNACNGENPIGAVCNDGLAHTIDDKINGSCNCAGLADYVECSGSEPYNNPVFQRFLNGELWEVPDFLDCPPITLYNSLTE